MSHAEAHILFFISKEEFPRKNFQGREGKNKSWRYLTGHPTGLVVDVGYVSTRLLPTVDGVPLFAAFREIPIGGRHIDLLLARTLARLVGSADEKKIRNDDEDHAAPSRRGKR